MFNQFLHRRIVIQKCLINLRIVQYFLVVVTRYRCRTLERTPIFTGEPVQAAVYLVEQIQVELLTVVPFRLCYCQDVQPDSQVCVL